ncbi:hypothetical protein G6O69_17080 [Pseudenhygromyxa sp. WMMC2535]|uniref:hypothetical protein n=1 Tax=Pseudenhygromyxa sp. WMMC2535 TaxID=2712867 RepID=UPI00155744CE|nr:hypothetical protein [Pseudenhygromyxa sp. WMMC2535]NVB39559.1 hypothetical protein [Pseudenhygromyxa sp. WMMC2535]
MSIRLQTLSASLTFGLGFSAACLGVGCADDEAEDLGDDTSGEMCVENQPLPAEVSLTVDGDDDPSSFIAACSVDASSVADGRSSVTLSCLVDGDDTPHEVGIEAPAATDAVPVGLESGAQGVVLDFYADTPADFGSNERLEVYDDDGLILAQSLVSTSTVTWEGVELRYDSYCYEEEDGVEYGVGGFVSASVGEESHAVELGEPQVIQSAGEAWDIYATAASDGCCHGWTFSAAMIRR